MPMLCFKSIGLNGTTHVLKVKHVIRYVHDGGQRQPCPSSCLDSLTCLIMFDFNIKICLSLVSSRDVPEPNLNSQEAQVQIQGLQL